MKRIDFFGILALLVAFGLCAACYTYWQQKIAPNDWRLLGVTTQPALVVGKMLTAIGYISLVMNWGRAAWIGWSFFTGFTLISVMVSAVTVWVICRAFFGHLLGQARNRRESSP